MAVARVFLSKMKPPVVICPKGGEEESITVKGSEWEGGYILRLSKHT